MPISSTDVSNILQAQIGMFSTSSQYAQAMSAQYGFQSLGGMGVHDPRGATHPANQSILAGNLSSGAIRGVGYGAAALSMGAAFGFGPRAFDPFSQIIHSGARGFRLGGVGGAIGMGMLPLAGYAAVGSAFNYASDQMMAGAQGRAILNSQIGGMFPRLGIGQVGSLSGMVEGMHRQGIGGLNELTGLMRQGQAAGTFQTGNITEFQTSFRKLVGNVRQIANVLNTSLNEAHQALVQVKSIGISSDRAAGFITTMRGLGQAGGVSPQQMLAAAGQGSQLAQQAGISREAGALGAMRTAGLFSMVESNKLIEGITAESQGRFTSAAFRFLGSRQGRSVLGAIMTPTGEYDPETASQIASGALSPQEIRRLSAQNLRGRGARDSFRVRRQELAAQFVSDFGPEGIMSTVGNIASASGRPETMRARLTGLNRRDFVALEQLAGKSSSLNQRLSQEALGAFRDGQRQLGVGDVLGMAADKFVGPIKERFREMGASLTQAVATALDTAANEFVQRPPPRADPRAYADAVRRSLLSGGGLGASPLGASSILPSQAGGLSGGIRGAVPGAFRMLGAGTQPGTEFSELPLSGFGTTSFSPYVAAVGVAGLPLGPQGGNLLRAVGTGMGSTGKAITTAAGAGFFSPAATVGGFGGLSTLRGSAALGGGALRATGLGLRGLGRIAGPIAAPLLAYDYLTNVVPAMDRAAGRRQIDQGSVVGSHAAYLRMLQEQNLLGEGAFRTMRVGGFEGAVNAETAAEQGLTPIGGTFIRGEGGAGGQQTFLTPEGRESLDAFMASSSKIGALSKKYGAETLQKATQLVKEEKGDFRGDLSGRLEKIGIVDKRDQAILIGRHLGTEALSKTYSDLTKDLRLLGGDILGEGATSEEMTALKAEILADLNRGDEGLSRAIDFAGELGGQSVEPEQLMDFLALANERENVNRAQFFQDRQTRYISEGSDAELVGRRAGSIMGISGLGGLMSGLTNDDQLGATFTKFQDKMRGLSPEARAQLGDLLRDRDTLAGGGLARYAYGSARIRGGIGKSRDVGNAYRVFTRGLGANFQKEDIDFIRRGGGDGRRMSSRLAAFLERGAESIMGPDLDGATANEKDALQNKLLKGLRSVARGEFDSAGFNELEKQLSTTYDNIPPGSGKPGGAGRQAQELEKVLDNFIVAFNKAVGSMRTE